MVVMMPLTTTKGYGGLNQERSEPSAGGSRAPRGPGIDGTAALRAATEMDTAQADTRGAFRDAIKALYDTISRILSRRSLRVRARQVKFSVMESIGWE